MEARFVGYMHVKLNIRGLVVVAVVVIAVASESGTGCLSSGTPSLLIICNISNGFFFILVDDAIGLILNSDVY